MLFVLFFFSLLFIWCFFIDPLTYLTKIGVCIFCVSVFLFLLIFCFFRVCLFCFINERNIFVPVCLSEYHMFIQISFIQLQYIYHCQACNQYVEFLLELIIYCHSVYLSISNQSTDLTYLHSIYLDKISFK